MTFYNVMQKVVHLSLHPPGNCVFLIVVQPSFTFALILLIFLLSQSLWSRSFHCCSAPLPSPQCSSHFTPHGCGLFFATTHHSPCLGLFTPIFVMCFMVGVSLLLQHTITFTLVLLVLFLCSYSWWWSFHWYSIALPTLILLVLFLYCLLWFCFFHCCNIPWSLSSQLNESIINQTTQAILNNLGTCNYLTLTC